MNIKTLIKVIYLFLFAIIFSTESLLAKEVIKKTIHSKYNIEQQDLKSLIQNLFPKERIEIKHIKNAVILSGNVSSAENSSRIEKFTKEYSGHNIEILNFMHIKNTQQVMLRVKLGEIINNSQSFDKDSNFDLLENKGIIKKIAEPNLISMSGEEAKFLSGGEIPIPVMQKDGLVTIEYKQYGLKVAFTPIVLSPNRIRISVEPEITEVVTSKHNNKFPAFSSRKAKTTIELAPGESFMIAGLVKDYQSKNSKHTSELVISVTPYLVNGMQNKDLRLPTDKIYNSNNLESKFINKMNDKFKTNVTNSESNSEGALFLEGPVGFVSE